MTWFKVDDKFHSHLKVARLMAGDESDAIALWTVAGSWSSDQLTDGFIPEYVAARLDAHHSRRADALVRVGLWERVTRDGEPGWQFHGWNDDGRQPTADQVNADRKANAERQARWRERSNERKNNAVTNALGVTPVTPPVTPTRPDPTRPDHNYIKNPPSPADAGDGTRVNGHQRKVELDEGFAAFWRAYPKRVGKKTARAKYETAIKNGADHKDILDGATVYALHARTLEDRYIAHPTTWLNQGRWDDEPARASPQTPPPLVGAPSEATRHPATRSYAEVLAEQERLLTDRPTAPRPHREADPWARDDPAAIEWPTFGGDINDV